jgi:hypothetical protein
LGALEWDAAISAPVERFQGVRSLFLQRDSTCRFCWGARGFEAC